MNQSAAARRRCHRDRLGAALYERRASLPISSLRVSFRVSFFNHPVASLPR